MNGRSAVIVRRFLSCCMRESFCCRVSTLSIDHAHRPDVGGPRRGARLPAQRGRDATGVSMAIEIWLAFVAASATLLVIPGPTVLLVGSFALGQGWGARRPIA